MKSSEKSSNKSHSSDSFLTDNNIESLDVLEPTISPRENINSLYSKPWSDNGMRSSSSSVSSSEVSEHESDLEGSKLITRKLKSGGSETSFVRGRPSACVFVASLCSTKSDDELCLSVTNHFKKWGKLSTVKVLRDTCNRPYAFVQYTNDVDSKNAIEKGHNSILDGRNIRCEAAKVNRTLFISSKSFLTEGVVKERLIKYGQIENLLPSSFKGEIFEVRNPSRGYRNWFCKFVYRDDAIRAFANLTEENLYRVEWAQNIERDTKASIALVKNDDSIEMKVKFDKFSIFVGQLNSEITEDDLRHRFEKHGEIAEINLIKKPSTTFAFIKFEEETSAASSVERENHSMFCGKTMHVQYREIHVPSSRSPSFNGVALAPPPINLNKRVGTTTNRPVNENTRYIGGGGGGYKTMYEFGKQTKFSSYPSNNYNRNFNRTSKFNTGRFSNERPYEFIESSSSGVIVTGAGGSSSGSAGLSKPPKSDRGDQKKSKGDYFTWSASNPTQLDLNNESQSPENPSRGGDRPDSKFKSKRGIFPKFDYRNANNLSRGSSINNSNIPLFYYFPGGDVMSSFGTPASAHSGPSPNPYYNVYQQYYPPFDPSEYSTTSHGSFAIPSYVYYPTESEIASNEKKT
ncbi:uncharacterized protein J8A68_000439 [[Candida] subhashii]|uniref:RRM domain-containing protein n=1 Tax=[Candida] subhashii TaxID=561895 RepID=A0A8J5QSN9_9ASCO|nr:uncharacterized protein J8A68_000439 [[Candida] subhashii]KAG7666009.1 hypothetical protein J8A68_000439 [[Candida] subhashii]